MTPHQKKQYLENLASRSKHLVQGARGVELAAQFTDAAKKADDPEYIKFAFELQRDARAERLANNGRTDGPKNLELNELRVLTVDNFVTAQANALSFFENVSLAPNGEPVIENRTGHEIDVKYLGQDGKAKLDRGVANGASSKPQLKILSTPAFEYEVMDLYKGDIRDASFANIDMAYDFTMKVNSLLWPYVTGQVGSFVTTGTKTSRTYVPHSTIAAANLPTTNALTVAGTGASTKWRLDCLKAILEYEAKWEGVMSKDGVVLRANTVFIASSDTMGFLDAIAADSESNPVIDQIFASGYVITLAGRTINLVGDATIDPAGGQAYVQFNKPIGEFYTKPSMDKTTINNSPELAQQNLESISMSKVIGTGLPTNWKINVAGVRYRNAA